MAAFYKITFSDYEGLQVILVYELLTIGNMDCKITHNKLTQLICTKGLMHKRPRPRPRAHTHTHSFPLVILN